MTVNIATATKADLLADAGVRFTIRTNAGRVLRKMMRAERFIAVRGRYFADEVEVVVTHVDVYGESVRTLDLTKVGADVSLHSRAGAWDQIAAHPVFAADYAIDTDDSFVSVVLAHLDRLHALEQAPIIRVGEEILADVLSRHPDVAAALEPSDAEIAQH